MGPKEKKAKKPKLTKAEKEKLKKEEAEQKAKEEEEARLLAEQAELERLEQEKIEAEERRLLEERERVRHQAEIDELKKKLEEDKEYLTDLKKVSQEKNKWDRYMLCDGRPNPTCKKEINSYINLTSEDTSNLNLGKVLKTCELILELIAELDQHIEEVTDELNELPGYDIVGETETEIFLANDDGDGVVNENENIIEDNNVKDIIKTLKSTIESYSESKEDLQKLINRKIDEASFALLKSPEENIDPDDLNIQVCEQTENLKICLWGNSAKNPRVKQVAFVKDAFTMELPKQMALLDIAVRTAYMNFDPFSCKSPLFHMKVPKKIEPIVDLPAIDIEQDVISEEQNGEITSTRNDLKSSLSVALSTKNVLSTKDIKSKSRLGTAMSRTASIKAGSKVAVDQASIALSKVEITDPAVEPVVIDNDDLIDDDVVDLRLFSPIGPLVYIDLLQLPPQPKEVKGWIMQQVVEGGLTRISYGSNAESTSKEGVESSVSLTAKSNNSLVSLGYNQPLAFTIRIDDHVMFHDEPLIARWDEVSLNWKLDGISDTSYSEELGTLTFQSTFFGPYAVIQDKYLSLPFQSWQLRSKGLNECVLNLVSATVEVDILIKEGECCVQFPEEIKVGHIASKWMKPQQLIDTLRSAGINLFPYEDGHKYVKIYPKLDVLVTPVYQYMALLASSFSFMLSKWNIECGEEKVVIQALECLKSESPQDISYNLYYATTRICYQLKMSEDDKEFSKDVVPNSPMHPDLYHMLRNGASGRAKERLKDTSIVFIDCVHQLLKACNVLVYS